MIRSPAFFDAIYHAFALELQGFGRYSDPFWLPTLHARVKNQKNRIKVK